MGDPMQQQLPPQQPIVTQQVIPGGLPPQQLQQSPQVPTPGPGQAQWVPSGQPMQTTGMPMVSTGPAIPSMGPGPSGVEMGANMGPIDDGSGVLSGGSAAQKMSERMRLDERELFMTPQSAQLFELPP